MASQPLQQARDGVEAWGAALCDDRARHHAHQKEVLRLDLDVECNPLSAQFSGRLYALMEQEEAAAQRGQTEAHARLSETVNVMMNQETKAHFDRQAEYSNKRWAGLFDRLGKDFELADKALSAQQSVLLKALGALPAPVPSDIEAARAQLAAARRAADASTSGNTAGGVATTASPSSVVAFGDETAGATRGSAAVGEGTADGGPSSSDGAVCWRERLRLQATAAWGSNEKYHLKVAFDNQISRVEDEWGAYEAQLNNDYETQRADIEGRDRGAASPSPVSGKQWKDKAKQEALIHTAPVHSPTAAIPASPSRGGSGATGAAAQRELRQLEASYRAAQTQFRTQKAAALRWITRQADRMYTQAAAHAATTAFVARCIEAHTERRLLALLRAECCIWAVRAALAAVAGAGAGGGVGDAEERLTALLAALRTLRQRAKEGEELRSRGSRGERGGGSGVTGKKAGAGARAQTAAGRTRPRKQRW